MSSAPSPADWSPLDPETAENVPDYDRATHPLAVLPPEERLHITLQILSAMPYRDYSRAGRLSRFSDEDLAELAGVTPYFVRSRRSEALARLAQGVGRETGLPTRPLHEL